MAENSMAYPVKLSIDYPDKGLNRLTTFFRLIMIIPILIIFALLIKVTIPEEPAGYSVYIYTSGYILFPTILMLLFRRKYPRWWFDWNVALVKFAMRFSVYFLLLRDEYPSTDDEQAVHIEIPYPNAKESLNRWLPLVKWFLAIPHFIVLCFFGIAAFICAIIAWFAILFTGRYPKGLFDFVVGVERWSLRVTAYCFLLTTDVYPPFRLRD
jgi:hypothetical protein